MPLHELSDNGIHPVPSTTFQSEHIAERQDLQRLLRDQIDVVAEGCLVLSEEFGDWKDSRRRIDLLCVDQDAKLVVVELKRTEDGGHMELQALRYAAMVSTMTFEQAVRVHARYLERRGIVGDAQQSILEHLGWSEPDEDAFGQSVRLVLVSGDFGKELTTSVLWLAGFDLDIRCVQLRPYKFDGRVLLDVRQVIPLPEASEYMEDVRIKEKSKRGNRESVRDLTKYDVTIAGRLHERLNKRRAMLLLVRHICSQGHDPESLQGVIPRKGNLWFSVDGEVDAEGFTRLAEELHRQGVRVFSARRWLCADGELIHANGRTYAMAGGWGGLVDECVEALLLATGVKDVRVVASEE